MSEVNDSECQKPDTEPEADRCSQMDTQQDSPESQYGDDRPKPKSEKSEDPREDGGDWPKPKKKEAELPTEGGDRPKPK